MTANVTKNDIAIAILVLLIFALVTYIYIDIDKDRWNLYYHAALNLRQTTPYLIFTACIGCILLWHGRFLNAGKILSILSVSLFIIVFIARKKQPYDRNRSISNLLMNLKHSYHFESGSTDTLFPLYRHQKERLFTTTGLHSLLGDYNFLKPIQQSRSSYWNFSNETDFRKEFKSKFGISGNYAEAIISTDFMIDKSTRKTTERYFVSEKRSQEVYSFAMPRNKERQQRRVKSKIMKLMQDVKDLETAEEFLTKYGCYYIDSVTLGGYTTARAEKIMKGEEKKQHFDVRSKMGVMSIPGFNVGINNGNTDKIGDSLRNETVEFHGGGRCSSILTQDTWDTWADSILEGKNLVIVECKFSPLYKLAPDENENILRIAHKNITNDYIEDELSWSSYFSNQRHLYFGDEIKSRVKLTATKFCKEGVPPAPNSKEEKTVLVNLNFNDKSSPLEQDQKWLIEYLYREANTFYCSIAPDNDKKYLPYDERPYLRYEEERSYWGRIITRLFTVKSKLSTVWKFEIEEEQEVKQSDEHCADVLSTPSPSPPLEE